MKAGPDRDRTVDTALKQAFAAPADVPASDACLDAETLAAWMDDGVDSAAVALAEAHVSSCARCQALVAAVVRTAPALPVSGTARSTFWRWWLAPIAAAAAAVTLWMVVPEAPSPLVTESPPPASGPAPAPSTPPAPRPSPEEARRGKAVTETLAREASKRAEATSADAAASSGKLADEAQARPAAPQRSMTFRTALPREIASPDAAVRWRIGANGAVDYTADGGRTWTSVRSGVTGGLVAGSAPSPAVCWLVGEGGLVLVSVERGPFARVSAPVDADLAAVEARDARSAVVTAVDGRAFVTDDSGRTWRRRQ